MTERCAGWKVRTIYCSLHRYSGEINGVNQRMGQHLIDENEGWRTVESLGVEVSQMR